MNRCPAACNVRIPARSLVCRAHWRQLTPAVRRALHNLPTSPPAVRPLLVSEVKLQLAELAELAAAARPQP